MAWRGAEQSVQGKAGQAFNHTGYCLRCTNAAHLQRLQLSDLLAQLAVAIQV